MKKIFTFLFILECLASSTKAQFNEFPTPSGNALYSGSTAMDPSGWGYRVIWVCGANGTVYRGFYYPYNWINARGNLSPSLNMYSIEALDSSVAFVGGNIGTTSYICKTTSGGNSWVQQLVQLNGKINAVWMRNALTGFAEGNPVGGRWSLWRTTNGGNTWDSTGRYLPASGSETGFNNSLWCKGDTILFGTNNSRIYFSSNYGLNWIVESMAPETNISALHYSFNWNMFPLAIWAGGSNYVLSSTNFGTNWTVYSGFPGTGAITGFCDPNCGVYNSLTNMPYIFMTRGNKIYADDPQISWYTFYTAPAGNYTFLFKKRNEPPPTPSCLGTDLVGIRDNGGVSLCGCYWGGVKRLGNEIPESFSLSQNYPNPFNPVTLINFQLSKSGNVKLIIYDALGREVTTLVNEQLKPGSYEVEWDGSNYTSGMYFYKLITESFSETKKLVLLK